jgi:hypothetical protein
MRVHRFGAATSAALFLFAAGCAHVRAQDGGAPDNAALGEQKTAVVLVNFTDNAAQPKTAAESHALVFGQVSDWFWEGSYQRTFLSGDTFGWFTIAASPTACDTATIVREGNRAAIAAGADLSAYGQVVYMFPYRSGCTWSGSGAVGAAGEKIVFINGTSGFSLKTLTHEMGHGFNLLHSNGWDCDASPLGDSCRLEEYADPADTMGNRPGHYNAFQKERLGWLGAAGAPPITTVDASGRHVLSPYETMAPGAKALKVLKEVDPVTGQKTWYYFEYRQPTGFDSVLAGRGNMTSGVMVRIGTVSPAGASSVKLLDMTPNTIETSKSSDFEDGAMAVGSRFVDEDAGLVATLVSADAAGAVLDIALAGAPSPAPATCTRAAPVLALQGPTTALAAGSTASYRLSVRNQDSSACGATTFDLARSVPAGWSGAFATGAMSLSPGASAETTLAVASPATAAAGSYGIGAGVGSSAGGVHAASAASSYTVAPPAGDDLTGAVGTDKASYARGETVAMSALVKSAGVPVGGAAVRFTVTLPNGSASVLQATSGSDGYARAAYRIGKGKNAVGSYRLRADASHDGAGTTDEAGFEVR